MVIARLLRTEKRNRFNATQGKLLTKFTSFLAKPAPKMPVVTSKQDWVRWMQGGNI